jgi:hypothetical protein
MMSNYSTNAKADKFYTDPVVAKQCIELLELNSFDLIIEPSVGSGSFSRHLPSDKTHSFDLFPDEAWPSTVQQDYLQFDLETFILSKNASNVLIIGNPPYGRSSGLALQFIKKSCISNPLLNIKTTIGFILAESFAKSSFMSRIPESHSLTQHKSLGSPFLVDGLPYTNLNTGWFVYEPIQRTKEVLKRESKHLKFHKKSDFIVLEDKDKCAIRAQGSGTGKVFWNGFETISESTTLFCSGPGVHVLEQINWEPHRMLTVGIPSLSKAEIVKEVELRLDHNFFQKKLA